MGRHVAGSLGPWGHSGHVAGQTWPRARLEAFFGRGNEQSSEDGTEVVEGAVLVQQVSLELHIGGLSMQSFVLGVRVVWEAAGGWGSELFVCAKVKT